ncbi:pimeloyl-ACP methyl ester carboxylesterase [Nonomuraea thailandensis]|uniref:Pimeloyl-ACP methyl ester carboxylesterase n=1 Tax=Nonomuraea thailandensis TaxID=1188745 RepID=A0A9X2GPM3_9ACTN|nr:alpha/beta hydrolase family protein [Nonomuraea thailandensis]MCP2358168.1 pimeloyl-ACP methyl ester carboxylesterase [Nonomuraea thailandensis]
MAEQRENPAFKADQYRITALAAGPAAASGKPLIVALHGGTYTARYFDVAGGPEGSFLDVAAGNGYSVVAFDRPGYGGSSPLEPDANTFGRHAELLGSAIGQAVDRYGAGGVFLVGHSIGGMIALMIAACEPGWPLIGVSATGVGAVIPRGGAAEALGSLPRDETVDLPGAQRNRIMFGPVSTYSAEALSQARGSYAPAPVRELIQAPAWPREQLPQVAPRVRVPVHNALAEFDALWAGGPENVARFAEMFTSAPFVDASVARRTGHCIDHHTLGIALHLRQLAFVKECAMWAEQGAAGRET